MPAQIAAFAAPAATAGHAVDLAPNPDTGPDTPAEDHVTCRCCGATGIGRTDCACSGFFCASTGRCVGHCPQLRQDQQHRCSSADGTYPATFEHAYEWPAPYDTGATFGPAPGSTTSVTTIENHSSSGFGVENKQVGRYPTIENHEVPHHQDPAQQLVSLWLHGRPAHTQRAYRGDVGRLLSRLNGIFLNSLTLSHLQCFADELADLAPASRYRILSAVKSLLAFGHRIGYLPFDVGRALRLPAVKNRLAERILPESDMHRILSLEENLRNRAILMLLYASAVRVSELCSLCWRDLQANGEGGQITVFGKGGKTRAIQIPASVWKLLCDLRDARTRCEDDARKCEDEPVFRSRKGGGLQSSAVLTIVRLAAERAGIELPVSPHWFRHAHASHALDRGAPIHLVQATLGHASINTTGRYLHARPQDSSSRFLPL